MIAHSPLFRADSARAPLLIFAESETALAVNRATEEFPERCLGGRVQRSDSPRVTSALSAMLVNVDTLRVTP